MNQYGGKAVASGTYGCVFRPALKCNDELRRHTGISKLMTTKHGEKEFDEMNEFKYVLKNISNYEKYFIFADNICNPDKLTSEDKEDININCKDSHFYNDIVDKENFSKFVILNIPDGGSDLNIYFNSTYINKLVFDNLNHQLKNLFFNAIKPMNDLKLLHCDIKDNNLMINENNEIKLIDWGQSVLYDKGFDSIHKSLEWRPLTFNIPISNIVFSQFYLEKINEYLKNCIISNNRVSKVNLKKLIALSWPEYINRYGEGQSQYFNLILDYINKYTTYTKITLIDCISSYTANSIFYYIKYKRVNDTLDIYFDYKNYFINFYSKNCDRHGLICTYLSLFDLININPNRIQLNNNTNIQSLLVSFSDFFYKHLFLSYSNIIDIKEVFSDLDKISNYFQPIPFTNYIIPEKQIKLKKVITPSSNINSQINDTDIKTIKERLKSIEKIYGNKKTLAKKRNNKNKKKGKKSKKVKYNKNKNKSKKRKL